MQKIRRGKNTALQTTGIKSEVGLNILTNWGSVLPTKSQNKNNAYFVKIKNNE